MIIICTAKLRNLRWCFNFVINLRFSESCHADTSFLSTGCGGISKTTKFEISRSLSLNLKHKYIWLEMTKPRKSELHFKLRHYRVFNEQAKTFIYIYSP